MKKMLVLLLTLLLIFSAAAFAEDNTMAERIAEINQDASITTTTALLDPTSPTGAYVTFRYPASEDVVRVAVGNDEMTYANHSASDIAPEDWQKGDWVYSNVRTSTARDMELIGDYWCLTMPATNGDVLYYFYIGGPDDEYVKQESTLDFCEAAIAADKQYWDPQNEPAIAEWETQADFPANQRRSLIYVPRAEGFENYDMKDLTVQDPNGTTEKGTISFCQISGPVGGVEKDINCAIYLPYGYDANSAEKYPLMVLSHGSGGDYTQWNAHGGMSAIFDNLTAHGKLKPTVVVMPDGTDISFKPNEDYADFVVNSILPYMEANYAVSDDPADRCATGLSAGGGATSHIFMHYTEVFGYYGIFSGSNIAFDFSKPELCDIQLIYVAFGDNDTSLDGRAKLFASLELNPDIPSTTHVFHGAHQMYFWRQALADLAENYLWK